MPYSELFQITSSIQQIVFKNKVNAKKLRVNRINFQTASNNNYIMLIRLDGFLQKSNFINSPYTFLLTMPNSIYSQVTYQSIFPDIYDVELDNAYPMGTHVLSCFINNDSTNTDISPSNPLYIEFVYE